MIGWMQRGRTLLVAAVFGAALAAILGPAAPAAAQSGVTIVTADQQGGFATCGGVGRDGALQPPCEPKPAKKEGPLKTSCPAGQKLDLFAGACYACPEGFERTLAGVTEDNACGRPTNANVFTDYLPAKFLRRGKACPDGQFFDPIEGGSCWSCPAGYVRSADAVTSDKACTRFHERPKTPAAMVSSLQCGPSAFFDPRNGGECWSCPSGYGRTAAPVTAGNACARDLPAQTAGASFKTATACGAGSFFDPRNGGECWSCPSGYKRSAAAVTAGNACVVPAREEFRRATNHGRGGGLLGTDCGGGQFWDPNGNCYSCPSGFNRTGNSVTSDRACSRAVGEETAKATFQRTTQCPSGTFFDPRNGGECWSCPSGYERSASAVTAGDACVRPGRQQLARASLQSKASCPAGSFFDPRNGGECWTCPRNFERSLSPVTASDACLGPEDQVRIMDEASATYGAPVCGVPGGVHDGRNGGECWVCPTGYERTVFAVNAPNACGKKAIELAKVKDYEPIHCNQYGADAFFDFTDGGSCWSCPAGYQRTLEGVKSPRACTTIGLDWVPTRFVDPGLYGLDGAAETAVELLSDPERLNAAITRYAGDVGEADVEGLRTDVWERIGAAPAEGAFMRGLMLQALLDAYAEPETATDAQKRFAASFEQYIRDRKVHLAENALAALKNWRLAQELREKEDAERRKEAGVPPSMTLLFDYGDVPPDFSSQLSVSMMTPSTIGSITALSVALHMAPKVAQEAMSKFIAPHAAVGVEKIVQQKMLAKLTAKFGKDAARRLALQKLGPKVAMHFAKAASGALAVVGVALVILDLNLEAMEKIAEAAPKLERMAQTARTENLRLGEWKTRAETGRTITTYWALATQEDGSVPRTVAAAAKAAADKALGRSSGFTINQAPITITMSGTNAGPAPDADGGEAAASAGAPSTASQVAALPPMETDLVGAARNGSGRFAPVESIEAGGRRLAFTDLDVAADGRMAAVDARSGSIFRRAADPSAPWEEVSGLRGAVRVAVGAGGDIWAVSDRGGVSRHDGRAWRPVGDGVQDIAVGPDGSVWAVGGEPNPQFGYQVLRFDGRRFAPAVRGYADRLSVDQEGRVWVVNRVGAIYLLAERRWNKMSDGGARDIAAGPPDAALQLDAAGRASVWDAERRTWLTLPGTVGLNALAVGPAGEGWALDAQGRLLRWR